MKTMRYFLTTLCLFCVLSMHAQPFVDQPQATFQSTSTMAGSGSVYASQPALSADGIATYEGASYAPAQSPSGPRRASAFDDFDDDMPLGDALIPLLIMAFIYALTVLYKRKNFS